ncbi:MAG: Verru_Chthon cassette protein D [Verrucomicrobiales bacterium]
MNPSRSHRAFTLIELLVVLAVIAIFFAMAAPQITGVLGSSRLSSSGEFVYNKLSQAQQKALTDSREIQVRFYRYADPTLPNSSEQFRALQFVGWNDRGDVEELTEVFPLDSGMIFSRSAQLSTMMTGLPTGSDSLRIPALNAPASFVSFVFHSDGSTSLPSIAITDAGGTGAVDNNWYLTIVDEAREDIEGGTPKNFYCIQIDPDSGRLTAYRP